LNPEQLKAYNAERKSMMLKLLKQQGDKARSCKRFYMIKKEQKLSKIIKKVQQQLLI
jgi:hypothetical protein